MNGTLKGIRLPAVGLGVVLSGLFGAAVEASQIVIDFSSGPAGVVAPQTFADASGLTVQAYYLDSGVWTQTDLFRRNDAADDLGFGVCSPGETCGTGSGLGDYNELSNQENPELIRLTLPAGWVWVSAAVSSADDNGSGSSATLERGQLWASANGSPGTTPGNLFGGAPLWQITGDPANQSFLGFDGSNNTSAYLFFEAYDWLNGTNFNNDYLIHSVTLETSDVTLTSVPEPTMLTLIGSGIAGIWRARRRSAAARRKTVAARH